MVWTLVAEEETSVVRVEMGMPVGLLQSTRAEVRVGVVDAVRNGGTQGRV